ncbi:MAG: hypothetical protein QOI51_758 [Nocardioidaceae bacterium]|jgi:peptidoglycan/LPS O-acetylase OafA/YrhL|nr:hypothetical protein [Nocardioidaceae bacterium]
MPAHLAVRREQAPPALTAGASQQPKTTSFRPDIQGLRALAVVSVVLGHAGIGGFSGGFVGVDVFFVISGFLITQLLLSEAQRTGSISLRQFYGRRARRILPAATLVLVVTLFASVLVLGYVGATSVVKDSIWVTFFAANVKFGRDGTDYFSADNPPSPLQHFWSLAVEEQFYLVWPLLLLVLLVGVGVWWRRRKHVRRGLVRLVEGRHQLPVGRILVALVVLGAASYVWSVRLVDRNPTAAYFSTPARAWELALGAVCAVLVPAVSRLPGLLRAAIGWVGLAGVVVAIYHYDASTPFPGRAALLPVVGTALIIAGGTGAISPGPRLLLGRQPLRAVGDWSYSLYLWHWPLLILAAEYLRRPLEPAESVPLLLVALAASALTYHLVENPFRRARVFTRPPRRGLLLYPVSIVVVLAACLAANEAIQVEIAQASMAPPIVVPPPRPHHQATTTNLERRLVAVVQASVRAAQHRDPVPGALSPPLLDLESDLAPVGGCDYVHPIRVLCREGDVASSRSIVVLGDSHARSWIPAIEPIAEKQGYGAYYLVKPGCNATDTIPATDHGVFKDCIGWRTWAMAAIERLHPAALIVVSDLPPVVISPDGKVETGDAPVARDFQRGLSGSLHELQPFVGHIAIVGDAPGLPDGPGGCLSVRGANLGECAFPPSHRWRLLFHAEHVVANRGGYQFVDTAPWFCADSLCPAVIGSTVPYRDREHLTTEYAAELSGPLQEVLQIAPAP